MILRPKPSRIESNDSPPPQDVNTHNWEVDFKTVMHMLCASGTDGINENLVALFLLLLESDQEVEHGYGQKRIIGPKLFDAVARIPGLSFQNNELHKDERFEISFMN